MLAGKQCVPDESDEPMAVIKNEDETMSVAHGRNNLLQGNVIDRK